MRACAGCAPRWIVGTDHAGIATQTQVEKKLAREGTSRQELGREAFLLETQAWRKEYGGTIIEQFKRLGASADYTDERFTMDDGYVRAVQKVFVDLYEQGLIYRDHYMVNWDPGSGSAISDLEVEEREGVEDTLYSIAYPLADGTGELIVATVRPETMFADVAVAVNPEDERYAHLVGQEVVLPLSGGKLLPIIADDHVKIDFGSGALKITPGHDPNDFEIGRRHQLPAPSAIGEDGRLTALCGEPFAGSPPRRPRAPSRRRCAREGCCAARRPTCTRCRTATAPAPASSHSSACSGSCAWMSSPVRRSTPCRMDGSRSTRRCRAAATPSGSARSAPGA